MNPTLAGSGSGLLAVWKQNEDGKVSGDLTSRDRVMASLFNGSAWTTPTAAVSLVPGLADLSAAYSGARGEVAYTIYIDTGNGSRVPQIFTSSWNGVVWSVAVQQTDDTLGNVSPRLVYTAGAQALLAWLADGRLNLRNLSTQVETPLLLPAEFETIDEFRVVQDGIGNIASVFTAQVGSQRDLYLYLTLFDQVHQVWASPFQLSNDDAAEKYIAPGMDASGRLLLAYTSTAKASAAQAGHQCADRAVSRRRVDNRRTNGPDDPDALFWAEPDSLDWRPDPFQRQSGCWRNNHPDCPGA